MIACIAIAALLAGTPRDAAHLVLPDGGWRVVETRTGGIAGLSMVSEVNSLGERMATSRGVPTRCDSRLTGHALKDLADAVSSARPAPVITDAELAHAASRVSDAMISTIVVERCRRGEVEVLRFAGVSGMDGTLERARAIRDALAAVPACDATAVR